MNREPVSPFVVYDRLKVSGGALIRAAVAETFLAATLRGGTCSVRAARIRVWLSRFWGFLPRHAVAVTDEDGTIVLECTVTPTP